MSNGPAYDIRLHTKTHTELRGRCTQSADSSWVGPEERRPAGMVIVTAKTNKEVRKNRRTEQDKGEKPEEAVCSRSRRSTTRGRQRHKDLHVCKLRVWRRCMMPRWTTEVKLTYFNLILLSAGLWVFVISHDIFPQHLQNKTLKTAYLSTETLSHWTRAIVPVADVDSAVSQDWGDSVYCKCFPFGTKPIDSSAASSEHNLISH